MRQRNIKNLAEKIECNSKALVKEPREYKGRWAELFGNSNPIYLEIGCGKGKFIESKALANPNCNFIACEGQSNVVLRALEKAEKTEGGNLLIFIDFVNDLGDYFQVGELKGIYLNFSDPWPKARHAKRRLTYRSRLVNYKEMMGAEGFVEFKTDNQGLFDFTVEEINAAGYSLVEITTDLHGESCTYNSKEYTTEYEDKFVQQGKKINYVKF